MDLMDELMRKLAQDEKLLFEILDSVAEHDEFIRNLLAIHKRVLQRGSMQKKPYASVLRSDFFFDEPSQSWKMIEVKKDTVLNCDIEKQFGCNCCYIKMF